MSDLGRVLILIGVGLVVVGGVLLLLGKLPGPTLGKLPGDFTWERGNVKIYFPLATMIILSIVLTIVVNLIMRWFR